MSTQSATLVALTSTVRRLSVKWKTWQPFRATQFICIVRQLVTHSNRSFGSRNHLLAIKAAVCHRTIVISRCWMARWLSKKLNATPMKELTGAWSPGQTVLALPVLNCLFEYLLLLLSVLLIHRQISAKECESCWPVRLSKAILQCSFISSRMANPSTTLIAQVPRVE